MLGFDIHPTTTMSDEQVMEKNVRLESEPLVRFNMDLS